MLLRRREARGHSRSARGTGAGSASGPPAGSGPAGCVRRAVRACFGRRPRRLGGERSRSQRPAGPRPALSPSRTIARRAAPPPPTGSPGPSRDPQSDPSRTLTRRAAAAPPLLRALGGEAPAGLSTGQGPGPRTHASAPQGRGRHAATSRDTETHPASRVGLMPAVTGPGTGANPPLPGTPPSGPARGDGPDHGPPSPGPQGGGGGGGRRSERAVSACRWG